MRAGPALAGKRDDPDFKSKLAGLWKHPSLKSHNWTRGSSTPPGDEATTLYRDHMTQYLGMINAAYGPVYKLAGYAGGFPLQVAGCLAFLMPKHAGSAVPDEACEIWEALRGSKDPRIGALCKKIKPMLKASCRHGAGPAA